MRIPGIRSSVLIRNVYPGSICRLSPNRKKVYLTFDDGPTPEITNWVLEQLKEKNFKATFFVVGQNVANNSGIYSEILKAGHRCGNHTHNHLKGWYTPLNFYLENIKHCEEYVSTNLFRPPYGRMTPAQFRKVKKKYRVVMWDVLSHDYMASLKPEDCLQNTMRLTRNGSIVVFHDSVKAWKNLEYVLPRYLDWLQKSGYECGVL